MTLWSYLRRTYFTSSAERDRRRKTSDEFWAAVRRERATRERAECEICSGAAVYLCPICRRPIDNHSHENDYICEAHGFVNPVRESDDFRITGDGSLNQYRYPPVKETP